MFISTCAVLLSLATAGVLGVKLEQTVLSLTRNEGKSVFITCRATELASNYVHWYQQKENGPLTRILYTDNQGVLGVKLEQKDLSLTRNEGKSVVFTCRATELDSSYVHWYQQKEDGPLARILYISSQNSVVPDSNHPDAKDFGADKLGDVYSLKINKLKKSHSAVYYCASWDYNWIKVFGAGTRLYVTEKAKKAPEVSVYPVSNQQDEKSVLLCLARNMFPDLVRFTWEIEDQNKAKVLLSEEDELLEQRVQTSESQITSMLITNKQKASQYTYTCSVQHEDGPKSVKIPKEIKEKPTKTCPTSAPRQNEEEQEEKFIYGSTELSRSAYLFTITYAMLLVKNVLYFCTVSFLLYKRRADNKEMLFGKVR